MSRDEITTERLSLRRLRADDLDAVALLLEQPELWAYENDRGLTRDESQAFLDRQLDLWSDHGFGGYAVRVGDLLIGIAGLAVPTIRHESLAAVTIGWRFAPTYWGHGYATEAAKALLAEAFTMTDRVSCVTSAENVRSLRLAERLGMQKIAEVQVEGSTAAILESRRPTREGR